MLGYAWPPSIKKIGAVSWVPYSHQRGCFASQCFHSVEELEHHFCVVWVFLPSVCFSSESALEWVWLKPGSRLYYKFMKHLRFFFSLLQCFENLNCSDLCFSDVLLQLIESLSELILPNLIWKVESFPELTGFACDTCCTNSLAVD